MKLFSWNVNGLRAVENKGELAAFFANFDPDIVGFQEIKAKTHQLDLTKYPQYHKFFNPAARSGYSGTAIFSKIEPLSLVYNFPADIAAKYHFDDDYGDINDEGRILVAEFDQFYFLTSYIPNSKGDLTRLKMRADNWDPALLEYIKQLEQTKPVLACGDFNVAHQEIDLANPKQNRGKHGFTDEERKGFSNFIAADLVDTFRHFDQSPEKYTWWTHWANSRARNVGWRIDYFLASKKLMKFIKSAQIHPEQMGSDHCPVSIEVEFND